MNIPAPHSTTSCIRIATPHYIRLAQQFLALAFPTEHRSVLPFGFFWDGSIVAVDGHVRFDGKYAVTAFFPESGADGYGTAEANIESLHTDLLDEGWEDTTRESTYRHLLAQGCSQPTYGEFLACQRPQFLGGLEEAANLAIQDAEVYWHVTAQLIDSVRGLTVGTKSTQVDLH